MGTAAEVKLWFQLIEDWSERLMTFIEKENPFAKLTDAELAAFIKKQKDRFNKKD
jgi:hypothetical protein